MKYAFIQKKWGVSVYKNRNVVCLIDNSFAIEQGFDSAIEYCKKVFN